MNREEIVLEYTHGVDLKDIESIVIKDYDPNKPTLLICDDYKSITFMLSKLVKRLELNRYFNVIYAEESTAVLRVMKLLLERPDINIDVLVTDITFGNGVRIGDICLHYDGIDLAGMLIKLNPSLVYEFLTGHRVSKETTPDIYDRYSKYTDDPLAPRLKLKDRPLPSYTEIFTDLLNGTEYFKFLESL